MKLINCQKPEGQLTPIDTPLNVRGQLHQTYRKELQDGDCEYFEHNQNKDKWMQLVSDED